MTEILRPDFEFINEDFESDNVTARDLDRLWVNGWRHFGRHFFRYNLGIHEFDIRLVIPLRIRLADFTLSKSQRRILRRNTDLRTEVVPADITPEIESMFEIHKRRFKFGTPDSIYDFLSEEPASVPCETLQLNVFERGRLIAASFFDSGAKAASGIYALFDPDFGDRSPGIFTMLKEIEWSLENEKEFYYQGYCYEGDSFYDYKKRFRATEKFDWRGNWEKF